MRTKKIHITHPCQNLYNDPCPPWWSLRFDGSCQGNGTRTATGRWAFRLQCEQHKTVAIESGSVVASLVTVNVAEWVALIHGLRAMERQPVRPVGLHIEGDSMLVVDVLSGRWKSKKPELTALRDECRDILSRVGIKWASTWIPREENEFCDSMTR